MDNTASYVYFVGNVEANILKIGKSNNVTDRVRKLQTGSVQELTVFRTVECATEEIAFALEKKLHNKFKTLHIRGEWFELSQDILDDVIDLKIVEEELVEIKEMKEEHRTKSSLYDSYAKMVDHMLMQVLLQFNMKFHEDTPISKETLESAVYFATTNSKVIENEVPLPHVYTHMVSLYIKYGIVFTKDYNGNNFFTLKNSVVKYLSSYYNEDTLSDISKQIITSHNTSLYKPSEIKSLYNIIDVEQAIVDVLELTENASGEELRVAVYKSKEIKPTKFSKTFAKDNMPKAIENLLESKKIKVLIEGRKSTYSIVG